MLVDILGGAFYSLKPVRVNIYILNVMSHRGMGGNCSLPIFIHITMMHPWRESDVYAA